MGPNKKQTNNQAENIAPVASRQAEEAKKNVNLLHVYTIYKQKFRRLTREEFEKLLGPGKDGKIAANILCKEFMKAKNIPEDVRFEKNTGFLSFPRFLPMIALLAERSEYKIKPSLVSKIVLSDVPERFREKFSQLLVYGFWFLGRVINDSLSTKGEVNRGNTFNFAKGDLGYWWAGVKILDWNFHVHKEEKVHTCNHFIAIDPPKYRFYSSRAINNMGQHPLYFLSQDDWANFYETVKLIKHKNVPSNCCASSSFNVSSSTEDWDNSLLDFDDSYEELSTYSPEGSNISGDSILSFN